MKGFDVDEFSEKNTKLQQKKQIIQKILSNKSVGIAGAGGLGSNVAIALARSGIKKFILVDFDRIEKSNLNRQYYFISQLNHLKVEALKDNIHQIDPAIECKIFSQRLENGSMEEPFANVTPPVENIAQPGQHSSNTSLASETGIASTTTRTALPDDGNGGSRTAFSSLQQTEALSASSDSSGSSQPTHPSTLHITLKRTGNDSADWQRLEKLHQVLKADPGADEFIVYIEDTGRKRIQLSFPNERTHNSAGLRERVENIVGIGNLRIL